MKKLLILPVAAAALFSLSASAFACDGMKDHDRAGDAHAKNDGKGAGNNGSAKSKDRAKETPNQGQPDNGATRS